MGIKGKYLACSVGTIAIWLFTAIIALMETLFIVVSAMDAIVAAFVLLSATISTVAVWWAPRALGDCSLNAKESGQEGGREARSIELNAPGGIWWKLAFVSAVVITATLPLWAASHLHGFPQSFPIPLLQPLLVFSIVPVVYLHVFVLWHWRIRYGGKRHIAWPILLACTAWPLFLSLMPASVFVVLAYCCLHLVPDVRKTSTYKIPLTFTVTPPASPLPKNYQVVKTACFVSGWVLVIAGVGAAVTVCAADILIWGLFEETLQYEVGTQFTESTSKALWGAAQVAKTSSVSCLLATLAAAVGAVFIQVSQRLRWRLLEERDSME